METHVHSQRTAGPQTRQTNAMRSAIPPSRTETRTAAVSHRVPGIGFSFNSISLLPPAAMSGPAGLRVSQPGDASEAVARRVTSHVLSESGARKTQAAAAIRPLGPAHAGERGLDAAMPAAVPGGGSPLVDPLRSDMEQRFQTDLGAVRIHTGKEAAAGAAAFRANAYTVGNHIVFGAGNYAPASSSGRALLAHELVHVLQQRDSGHYAVMREATADQANPPLFTTEEALAELRSAEQLATASPPNLAAAQASLFQVERWLTGLRFSKNFDRQFLGRGASYATADILVQNALSSVQLLKRLLRLGPVSAAKWNLELNYFVVAQPFLRQLNHEGDPRSAELVSSVEKAGQAGVVGLAGIAAAPILVGAALESGLATSLSIAVLSNPVRATLIAEFLAALGLQAVASPEEFAKSLTSPAGWAHLLWNVMLLRYSIRAATLPDGRATTFTRPSPTPGLSKDRIRLNVLLGTEGSAQAQQVFDEATLNRAAQYAGQNNANKRFVYENGVNGVRALLAAQGELETARDNLARPVVGLLPAAPKIDDSLLTPLLPAGAKADTRAAFGVLLSRLRTVQGDYVDKARLFQNLIPRMREVKSDWNAIQQFTADNGIIYQGQQGIYIIFHRNNRIYYTNSTKVSDEAFARVFRFQRTGRLSVEGIWHIDYEAGLANKVLTDVTDPK